MLQLISFSIRKRVYCYKAGAFRNQVTSHIWVYWPGREEHTAYFSSQQVGELIYALDAVFCPQSD